MLKIFKSVTLYFLAAAVCEYGMMDAPMQVLNNSGVFHQVTVTAYTSTRNCGDEDPFVTASSKRIKSSDYGRVIALSSDLAKKYEFGDKFQLWVDGKMRVVEFADRMPKKHRSKVDLLLPSLKSCRQFGRSAGILIPLDRA